MAKAEVEKKVKELETDIHALVSYLIDYLFITCVQPNTSTIYYYLFYLLTYLLSYLFSLDDSNTENAKLFVFRMDAHSK
jgi:hypothetical protein